MSTHDPNDGKEPKEHGAPHERPHTEPMELEGPPMLTRRGFIKSIMGLAIGGAIVGGAASQVVPAIAPDAFGGGGRSPIIQRDKDTNAKIPVTVDLLAGEPPVELTGEWAFLPAKVFKVQKSILEASSAKRGYNTAQFSIQHPTEPENAIVVYEGKCKHLGCTVGWNGGLGASKDIADYNEDGKNDGRILCPCHQGQYDIYDLAKNVPGTPPPAPLNVIRWNIGDYTDDAGESYSNVLIGFEKLQQNAYRDADQEGDGSAYGLGSQAPTE